MEQWVAYLAGNNTPNEGTSRTGWHIEKADGSALSYLRVPGEKTLRCI
jgi:hypothetical protein